MRYMSDLSTILAEPSVRRRFELLPWSKCRFPACEVLTFPEPVILKRFETAFYHCRNIGHSRRAFCSCTR